MPDCRWLGVSDCRATGQGQKLVEIHEDEFAAEQALEALTQLERQ